jgi:hypothetical protein
MRLLYARMRVALLQFVQSCGQTDPGLVQALRPERVPLASSNQASLAQAEPSVNQDNRTGIRLTGLSSIPENPLRTQTAKWFPN